MANTIDSKEQAYNALIEEEYQLLIKEYLASNHRKKTARIEKAFLLAKTAHKGIVRKSGEPYIMHPLAVARIVAKEIGLGSTSICAALLHDVVEDTEYTVEDIAGLFDPKIAQIVDGLTKISGRVWRKCVGTSRKFSQTIANHFRRHSGNIDKNCRQTTQYADFGFDACCQTIQNCGRNGIHIRTLSPSIRTIYYQNRIRGFELSVQLPFCL